MKREGPVTSPVSPLYANILLPGILLLPATLTQAGGEGLGTDVI